MNMKNDFLKKIIVIFIMLILTIFLILTNYSTSIYIIFSIIITIISVIYVDFDITHPCCWFIPIFTIYQIAYPWLKILGIDVYDIQSLNQNYVILNWVSLMLITIIMINVKKVKYDNSKISINLNKTVLNTIYIISLMLSFVGLLYINHLGFKDKYTLSNSSNIIIIIINIILNSVSLISLMCYLSKNNIKKFNIFVFISSTFLMIIGMGITGERDLIIRHFIMFLLYFYTMFKPSKKKILIYVGSVIVFLLFSSSLKMFLVRKNVIDTSTPLLVKFLTSDFQAAGFNFNYLLNNINSFNYKKGITLIYDFLSPIRGIIKFPISYMSTSWYQITYWPNRITGLGFSILGEGLINFGYFGVLLWCIILSLIVIIFYKNSNKSIYSFAFFVSFCPICMYIMRADLANLISPTFKYSFLGLVLIYFLCNKSKS